MFSTARRRCLLSAPSHPSQALPSPGFILPAFHAPSNASRNFSTSSPMAAGSKVGAMPLSIPQEVTFQIVQPPAVKSAGRISVKQPMATARIKGPLGELELQIPPFVSVVQEESTNRVKLAVLDREERAQREMWGTTRAYLQNYILGVSEGHTAILRLVGVGYRATIEKQATTVNSEFEGQEFVNLKVGFSHPVELPIPKGVKASTPQPTRILLEGIDKEVVMSFAADIRAWRKPEPYKGKGIFVNGETIKLKNKKIK